MIRQMGKQVDAIGALEPALQKLTDDELKSKSSALKEKFAEGQSLDDLLIEAFAVCREASVRTMGMRHYDVQLIGAMVLHQGKISEMKTGEGKTLMATLAVYLNSLAVSGVHLVTVNDYLARRDADWMRPLYNFLGLSVGVVVPGMSPDAKIAAYASDVTYGTNNEFGFDYLRDNMAFTADARFQRKPFFAIVDEVDSILIDEARTPLIISGPTDDNPRLYVKINKIIPSLVRQEQSPDSEEEVEDTGDYTVDEKQKQTYLTEMGMLKVEKIFVKEGLLKEDESLYDAANLSLLHHLNAALRANVLFTKDVDYIISNGDIVIVDEFTGRTLAGRRWSDGLHQAIEAKEGVPIQKENHTLASITFQNYFRLYSKLSGMTGTADTEAYEFQNIYGLEVVVIPTDKVMVRDDMGDVVFLTQDEKYNAIVEDIKDCHERRQPALVGTTSIETSELISKLLKKQNIKHEVLNAKQHDREAQIVAQAGSPGAITIATNMAGRGTDIVLGGNLEVEIAELGESTNEAAVSKIRSDWTERHQAVLDSGGLHIIGTERHESRRIDNQLRGRSGRQGDAGSSRFYLSLQDSLMRVFASDRVSSLMQKLGMQEDEAIEHPWVSKAIENAQRKVEAHNFDMRKNLLEYDDVANDQRKVVYEQRNELMDTDDIAEILQHIRFDVFEDLISTFLPPGSIDEQWDIAGLEVALDGEYGFKIPVQTWLDGDDSLHEESLRERLYADIERFFNDKETLIGAPTMRNLEKHVMLNVLDSQWKDHLARMDYLRQSIGLRGYAQKQPKQEYRRESFEMFTELLDRIKHEVIKMIAKIQIRQEEDIETMDQSQRKPQAMQFNHAKADAMSEAEAEQAEEHVQPFVRDEEKVGRNHPCPCGSGRKYKHCHGKLG